MNTLKPAPKLQHEAIGRQVRCCKYKPLPYMLANTNLILHDIISHNIRYGDALQRLLSEYSRKGRAAVVLPDGSLTGDGVKQRIRQKLLDECNLYTIVRLPNSVFQPYASVATNLLFFTKGEPS